VPRVYEKDITLTLAQEKQEDQEEIKPFKELQ
jgi:hypothetical protein